MCGACTATSSIILPKDNECIVERNIHNKPEGVFSKKEMSKFLSTTAIISAILASGAGSYMDCRSHLSLKYIYML